MQDWKARTQLLLGPEAMERLAGARITVFGLGAVGSYAVEALARAGVGSFRLVDFDRIKESNRNRQLFAVRSTIGRMKAEVGRERILDINPDAEVDARTEFAHTETLPALLDDRPDLVIDAVDSVSPKVAIIAAASATGVPVFSSMGAATRLDADAVKFAPLFEAKGCPLARAIRKRLRRGKVEGDLWCVYSDEEPDETAMRDPDDGEDEFERGRRRRILGSVSTMTGMFGLRLAHEAILRITSPRRKRAATS